MPTSGSADETLRLWNLAVLLVAEDSGETNVNEREEAPKGNGGGARAHAIPMRKISVELKSYGGSIKCCSFNATGTLLCSGSGDNLVRVWRIRDRSCLHTLKGHKNWVLTLACSPLDECQFATGSSDGTVRVWNLNTASSSPSQSASATVLKPSKQPGGGVSLGGSKDVTAVAYHPLGNLLCTAGVDKLVRVWALPDGTCQRVLQGHRGHINGIAFQGGTGRVVASVEGNPLGLNYFSSDNSLILWDLEAPVGGEMLVRLGGHKRRVNCCAFNGSGDLVVTGGNDNSVRLWVLSSPLARLGPGEEGRLRRPDSHHSWRGYAGKSPRFRVHGGGRGRGVWEGGDGREEMRGMGGEGGEGRGGPLRCARVRGALFT
jgi:WD40 repeat protein